MARRQSLSYDTGNKPYLFLCASKADDRRIRTLLVRLVRRGVRVWVSDGGAKTAQALRDQNERMLGATLVAVYLSEAFRTDLEAKSRALVCQANGLPLLCLNMDGGDSGLSLGFRHDTPSLPLKGAAADEIEDALLHADGFTQELIGEPVPVGGDWVRYLAIAAAALAALVLIGTLLIGFLKPKDTAEPEVLDTVTVSDPTLSDALHAAIGGAITEEALNAVTELTFSKLPDDLSELSLLPNLSRIMLDQASAFANRDRIPALADAYELILIGGDGS